MTRHPIQPAQMLEPSDRYDASIGNIGFVRHRDASPKWALARRHDPKFHIMAYAVRGKAHYQLNDQHFTVEQGQFVQFGCNVMRAVHADPKQPWSFYSVGFELQPHDDNAARRFGELPFHAQSDEAMNVPARFAELEQLWLAREPGYMLRCRAILMTLMHLFVRCCTQPTQPIPHAQRITKIVRLLQQHYTRSYSVDQLSEMADLSASRFSVLFKQLTGYSVVRYQNWLRINKAKDLLLSGEYSVTEAARAVGFDDVYYFSRLFRKMTGENASAYRNR